jgi:hypothetical protein
MNIKREVLRFMYDDCKSKQNSNTEKKILQKQRARSSWLTPVILTIWEAEREDHSSSQPRQIVRETPISRINHTKMD